MTSPATEKFDVYVGHDAKTVSLLFSIAGTITEHRIAAEELPGLIALLQCAQEALDCARGDPEKLRDECRHVLADCAPRRGLRLGLVRHAPRTEEKEGEN